MGRPFLTVLIDTYNHERFIAQAITSVLEQDFPAADREILVVDDGSTDRTPEIIRTFGSAVRVLRKANGGQASAFNAGIPEARGEIVAFLDGDDWWAPSKLAKVVEALESNPEVGLVGHGIIEVIEDGDQRIVQPTERICFRADSVPGARIFRLRKCFLGTSRMTVRRHVLGRILSVPDSLKIEADEFLFTLAGVLSNVVILREPLTYYRIHGSNLYQTAVFEEVAVRRKGEILSSLARELAAALSVRGVSEEVVATVTEEIRAESEQLQLALTLGWPWRTVGTELRMFRIQHEGASIAQRVFKVVGLLPASVLPSRWYYSARRRLTSNSIYLRARNRWLPPPRLEVVQTRWQNGS